MKYTIRALGWLIYVLWLVIIVFTATALYSVFQLQVEFGEPQTTISRGTIVMSQPFSIENNGLYSINDLNLTTILLEPNGVPVTTASTVVRLISTGERLDSALNISISLNDVTSAGLSHLLFNDTNLNFEMSLALRYADIIPFGISTNNTLPWAAPLYNFTIGDMIINPSGTANVGVALPLSFENHSFFGLNGTVRTEIINTLDQQVSTATAPINAPPQSSYSTQLQFLVPIGSAGNLKEARVYFDTSAFSYGPVVIPLV